MHIFAAKRRRRELLRQRIGLNALVLALLLAGAASGQLAPAYPGTTSDDGAAAQVPNAALTYRSFPLQHIDASTAQQRLAKMSAAAPGLDVIVDAQRNRVLVRGNAETHQLVAQMLQNIDRAPTEDALVLAAPAAPTEPEIAAYPLNDATRVVFDNWRQQLAGRPDVRLAFDERTAQVLVYAPPPVHAQITQQLAQATKAAAAPATEAPPASQNSPDAAEQPATGLTAPAGTVVVQLRNLTGAELHQRLERLVSRPLPMSVDATGDWQGFAVEASPGVGVTMNVNTRTGQVRIEGPPLQVAAWRSVVEAMDSPPSDEGTVTQLVATKPAVHERVRKALDVLSASAGEKASTDASLTAMMQPQAEGQATQPSEGGTQVETGVLPGGAQSALDAAQLAEVAGGLLGPVQVEYVEGLDVIVIRGAERDVQRVMEIIKRIEELSVTTVPAIEVYNLKNVSSVDMATLLNQLYTEVLAARIGTVNITALGKPNALLLIGRTENVKMAIDLVKRLDQPVAPFGQFEVFTLQNASATEAKTVIDAYLGQAEGQQAAAPAPAAGEPTPAYAALAPRALVVADPRTNSLIVSASPRDLAEIAALLNRIDAPGMAAVMKVFTVKNGDAESLANTLRTLFGVSEDAAAEGPGLSQGGPVRVQFSVDARTNSIIAVGSQDDLVVVESILLRLDEGDIRERINHVYRLKNAYSVAVATALQQLLQSERQAETEADVAISPFEQIEREVVIVPEEASNSLLISATPRYYQRIIQLVEDLDERPPMVLIQVLIAEVRLNDWDQFGVELGLQDSLLFDRSLLSDVQFQNVTTTNVNQTTTQTQTIISANGQPGFNFNNPATTTPLGNNLSTAALATANKVAAQGLSNFDVRHVDPALGFGGFIFSASSDAVSILLRALQANQRIEVLSRPQLMALDGQPGYVQVGQDVPTIIATSVDPIAGTTNSIQYRQVGLILEVIPRISPDGLVVMSITANKSEVGPEIEGIPIFVSPTGQTLRAPRIDVTQARTTISALSGQTVVLGGLIQTRKQDIHRRVPIVADIPLLGDFFRYDSVAEERRELLIVMTPQIIYNTADSNLVKQIESSRMSWCLADVVNVHGEAGLRSRCDEWYDGETEAVYPTCIPEDGELLPMPSDQMGPIMMGPVLETPGSIQSSPSDRSAPTPADMQPTPPAPGSSLPTPPPPTDSQSAAPLIPPQPLPPADAAPMMLEEIQPAAVTPAGHQQETEKRDLREAFNSAPRRLPKAGE